MILIKQLRYIVFILCALSFQALAELTITGGLTFTYTNENGNSRNYRLTGFERRFERIPETGGYDSWVDWVVNSALFDRDEPGFTEEPNGRRIQAVHVLNSPDAGLEWSEESIVFFIELNDSTWAAFRDAPLENAVNRPSINPPEHTLNPTPGSSWSFMGGLGSLANTISPVLFRPRPRIFSVTPSIIGEPEITEDANGRSISSGDRQHPIVDETRRSTWWGLFPW